MPLALRQAKGERLAVGRNRPTVMRGHVLLFLSLFLPLTAACSAPGISALLPATPDYGFHTFKIGLVAPFTGERAAEGARRLYAVRQAVAEFNESAGDRRWRAEVVAYDEVEGEAVAGRMAADPDVLGALGYDDGREAAAAAPRYAAAQLPLLALAALPERDLPGVFQMVASADGLVEAGARLVQEQLGRRRAAVVGGTSPGAGPAQVSGAGEAAARLVSAAERGGLAVRVAVSLPLFTTDHGSAVLRVSAAAPEVVILAGATSAEVQGWMRQRAGSPMLATAPLVLMAPLAPEALPQAGPPPPETYWVSTDPDTGATEAGLAFASRHRERWGTPPTPAATLAYDAAGILLRSLDEVLRGRGYPGTAAARAAVRDHIGRGRHEGAARSYAFDERARLRNARVYLFRLDREFPGTLLAETSVP